MKFTVESLRDVIKLLNEHDELILKLKNDFYNVYEIQKISNEKYWETLGRVFVKNALSLVEAIVYLRKQEILIAAKYFEAKERLTKNDLRIIKEGYYMLDAKGRKIFRNEYIPLTKNIKWTFRKYAEIFEFELEFADNETEWHNFKESIRIRNRLTHPKKLSDLEVTEEEFTKVMSALNWFISRIIIVSELKDKTLNKYLLNS